MNQWFHYYDPTVNPTPRFCEVDVVVEFDTFVVAVECKLTQHLEHAWNKLARLYVPIVTKALGKPVAVVQVYKNALVRDKVRVRVTRPEELAELEPGAEAFWHWL